MGEASVSYEASCSYGSSIEDGTTITIEPLDAGYILHEDDYRSVHLNIDSVLNRIRKRFTPAPKRRKPKRRSMKGK